MKNDFFCIDMKKKKKFCCFCFQIAKRTVLEYKCTNIYETYTYSMCLLLLPVRTIMFH